MRSAALLFASILALPFQTPDATENPPVIYMIGDSTMANKELENGNPERGWGQLLPEFFQPSLKIENRASDGRSTKSFINEGRWHRILTTLQPGDWVIIQFGHNDQKKDKADLYADPTVKYPQLLAKFVEETRAKGAQPILVTSICRRRFKPDGTPKSTLGLYPQSVRDLATELQVPLVDLNSATEKLLAESGEEGSKPYFLHFAPGELEIYPKGKQDNTHLSERGARKVAELFVLELKKQNSPLCLYLK